MSEKTPSRVTAWDPFAHDDFFSRWPRFGAMPAVRSMLHDAPPAWSPAMDVSENDDAYVITVELAGASKEDVTVEAHENVLTIRGEKRSERNEENEQRKYVERSFGSFSRSFSLPANADADAVEASFDQGVLTVQIAKTQETKPKQISVK